MPIGSTWGCGTGFPKGLDACGIVRNLAAPRGSIVTERFLPDEEVDELRQVLGAVPQRYDRDDDRGSDEHSSHPLNSVPRLVLMWALEMTRKRARMMRSMAGSFVKISLTFAALDKRA